MNPRQGYLHVGFPVDLSESALPSRAPRHGSAFPSTQARLWAQPTCPGLEALLPPLSVSPSLAAQGLIPLPSTAPPCVWCAVVPRCSEEELLEPRHHPTTRTPPHSVFEWSDRRQARYCPACWELHPLSSSSCGPAHLSPPFSPGLSSTPWGTLCPTSACASRLRRGADGTFLRLSYWPSVHYLRPIAPWHAREVRRSFLRMDLSISESVYCSVPTQDKNP